MCCTSEISDVKSSVFVCVSVAECVHVYVRFCCACRKDRSTIRKSLSIMKTDVSTKDLGRIAHTQIHNIDQLTKHTHTYTTSQPTSWVSIVPKSAKFAKYKVRRIVCYRYVCARASFVTTDK